MNQPLKSCGTCIWARNWEMEQGQVVTIRCQHPSIISWPLPDWVARGGVFPPTEHGQHCDTWTPIVTDVEDVDRPDLT